MAAAAEGTGAAAWAGARGAVVRWKHRASGEVESSAVVSDSRVFAAAAQEIFALDRETGKRVWTFATQGTVLASGVLAADLYLVGCDDEHFYALSQETGELRWKFKAGEFTGGATVDEERGVVLAGSVDGLYAYSLSGEQRFVIRTTKLGGGAVNSSPAVDKDGNILFGDDKGFVWKVSSKGDVLWKHKFQEGVRSPIVVTAEGLLLSTGDPDGKLRGSIVRMSPAGEVVWTSVCSGGKHQCDSCWTAPQPVGGVVVAGCGLDNLRRGAIWGVSLDTGELRWKIEARNDCQTSSPVHLGDGRTVVLGCTDGVLYAVDALEGKVAWTFQAKQGIWATPAMDNRGILYVGSHDGYLYALAPSDRSDL